MKEPVWRLYSEEQYLKSWHTTVLTNTPQLLPLVMDAAASMVNNTSACCCSYNYCFLQLEIMWLCCSATDLNGLCVLPSSLSSQLPVHLNGPVTKLELQRRLEAVNFQLLQWKKSLK